jgi:hypothetical protein
MRRPALFATGDRVVIGLELVVSVNHIEPRWDRCRNRAKVGFP